MHARRSARHNRGSSLERARRRAKRFLRADSAQSRRSKYKQLVLVTFIGSAIGALCTLPGATYNWTGGDSTLTWSDKLNWNPNGPPGAADTAIFNGPGGGGNVIDLGTGVSVDNIIFDTGSAAAYTLGTSTSESLTLSNGGAVTMNSTVLNNEVINAALTLGDATAQTYTFINNSLTNTLTFAGNIAGGTGGTAGAKTLGLGGAGNITLSGVIGNGGASALGISVSGGGAVTLNGSAVNTFTGPVTIQSGVLVVDLSHLASATDLVNSSATLTLAGGTLSVVENANATAEQDFSNVSVHAGASAIVLNAGTAVAQMVISNITRTVGATVDFTAMGDARIIVSSSDTAGSGANAILGGWATANGGTTWELGSNSGTFFSNFETTTVGGTTASNYSGTNIDVTSSPGVFSGVISPVSIRFNTAAAETLTLATGNNIISSGGILVTPNVGNNAEVITGGTLEGAPGADLIVYVESASSTLTINSKISNDFAATGLTKSGPGTLVLSGFLNNFSGNIAINGGTLEANGDEALGSTGVITLGTPGGTNNASLISLSGYSILNTINVASQPSGTLTIGNSVVSSYFSTVNLGTASAPSNLTVYNGNTSATGSTLEVGAIGGTGNLTLDSAGTGTGPASITVEGVNTTGSITNTGNSAGGGTTTLGSLGSTITSITQNSASNSLILSGTDSFVNTTINVVAGTLYATSASALGGTGSITLGGGSGSATLEIGMGGGISNPIVLAAPSSGTLTIFGSSTTPGATVFTGGLTGTGNLIINSAGSAAGGAVTFFGSSLINNVGSITNYGPVPVTTTLSAPIGPNVTQVVQNDATGVLIIGGNNSGAGFAGTYQATAGILQFALPSQESYLTTSGKLTVASAAALAFNYGGASDFTAAQIATVSGTAGVASGAGFGLDTTNGPTTGSALYRGLIPSSVSNFYKLGSNALTLTNPGNAYTGSTFIAAGALVYTPQTLSTGPITFIELNGASGALQPAAFSAADFSARVVNSTAAIGVDTTNSDVTLGGGLASSNTGGLNKVGLGSLFMSGTNSYSGPTTLTAGTLSLAGASAIPAASTIAFNGGAIDNSTGAALSLGNAVSITGSTLGVGTAITFASGGSTNDINFANATATTVSSGGTTITFNGVGQTLTFTSGWNNTLDGSGTYTVNGAGNTLSLGGLTLDSATGGTSQTQTFAGSANINVTGLITDGNPFQSLTYAGTGTMTLSGAANTYTGITTVSSGVLSVANLALGGSPSSIGESGNNAAYLDLAGGTLRYTGSGATTDRNFTLSANSAIDSSGTGALIMTGSPTLSGTSAVLTLAGSFGASGTSNSISGAITGAIGITKTGTNYWTLDSATAYGYTGPTTVNQGELIIAPGAIATGQTAITINGGTLDANLAGATTGVFLATDPFVMNGGNFTVTGKSGATVTQTFSTGKLTFNAGFSTIKLDDAGGTAANLTESSASSFVRTNGATLFLDLSTAGSAGNFKTGVASTFEGWTVVENSAGVYGFGLTNTTDELLPQTTQTALTASNPTGTTTDYLFTAAAGGSTIASTANPTPRSLQFATSAGAATWDLGTKTAIIEGGALLMAPNASNTATISTGTLESGFGTTPDLIVHVMGAGEMVISANIADKTAGSTLTKDGTGTLVLLGVNTYTGATYVNQGTLQFDSSTAPTGTGAITISGSGVAQLGQSTGLPASIAITFAANSMGKFQLNGNNFTAGSITSNAALLGAPVVENGGSTNAGLILTGATNFAGVIQDGGGGGTLSLEVASGTTILSGANTFSGVASVSGTGIVIVNNSSALGSSDFALDGGTLVNGVAITIPTYIYVAFDRNSTINTGMGLNFTLAGALSGEGNVSAGTGTGALLLSGNNNLNFAGTFTEPSTSPSALHFLNAFSGSAQANWVFNGTGGVFFDPTLSGGTISFGSLNGSETIGSAPGANGVTISAGALDGTDTYSGAITGNNAFTKVGTGTQTLSGPSTYTGQTSIQSGTLVVTSFNSVNGGVPLRASSSLGDPTTVALGTINIGSGATSAELSYTGTGETTDRVMNLAGTTGGATLDQSGSGTLTFTGNFTATGAGPKTLTLQGSTSAGGTIEGSIVDNSGSNPTSVTKQGTGLWILSGPNTYTGQTRIEGGQLVVYSLNSVNNGAPPLASSSLGAPTTVATGTLGIGSGAATGELLYDGLGETTDRVVDLAGTTGGATLYNGSTEASLTFTSNFTASGAGSKILTLENNSQFPAVIAGAIVDHAAGTSTTGVAVQSGSGPGWTLEGANTYTGSTNVTSNTLTLNATNGVGTLGNTAITVGAFGTLNVAGTPSTTNGRPTSLTFNGVEGAFSLVDGSINSFSIGGPLTVSTATALSFELGVTGGSSDLLAVSGAATISAATTINLALLPGNSVADGSYTLITAASGLGGSNFQLGATLIGFNKVSLSSSTATAEIATVTGPAPITGNAYWTGLASANHGDSNNYWGYGASLSTQQSNWSTTANGLTDPIQSPGAATTVIFTASNASAASGTVVATLDSNYNIKGLTFDTSNTTATVSAVNIATGNYSLGLGVNGLTVAADKASGPNNNSAPTISGNGNVVLNASQSWNNNSAELLTVSTNTIVGTAAKGNTQTLIFAGSGSGGATLPAEIGDGANGGSLAVTVNQTGTGVIQFTTGNQNSYSGGTTVLAGTLLMGTDSGLPNGGSVTVSGPTAILNLGNDQAFSGNVLLSNGGTISGSGVGSLYVYSPNTVTLQSGTFSGNLVGEGAAVNKTTSGTVVLSGGNNYFTGPITISAGILMLGAFEASLGYSNSSGASVTVNSGGTLDVNGETIYESLAISGSGQGGVGALESSSTIESGYLYGNITNTNATVNVPSSSGSLYFAGGVTGTTLTKIGAGPLTFTGSTDDTGLGLLVNNGTVYLDIATSSGAVHDIEGNLTVNYTGTFGAGSASVILEGSAPDHFSTSSVITLTNGTLYLQGQSATFDALNGSAAVGGSTLGGIITNNLSTPSTLTIGSNNGSGSFAGVIEDGSGTIAVVKNGTGTETFSGSNTYSGGTTVNGGTLQITNANSLGKSSATVAINAATLEATQTLLASQGVIVNNAASTIMVDSGQTLTLQTAITGSGALNKAGSGSLVLSATTNTFAGTVTVNGGTLAIHGSLSGNVTVVTGATFDVSSLSGSTLNVVSTQMVVDDGTVDGSLSVAGILSGAGSITPGSTGGNSVTATSGGTIQPGSAALTGKLTLTGSGSLNMNSGSTLAIGIAGSTSAGLTSAVAASSVTLSTGVALSLSLLDGYQQVANGSLYFITEGAASESGTFDNSTTPGFVFEGGSYTVLNSPVGPGGQRFAISYDGSYASGTFTGGHDIVLEAVPEPGTVATLFAGLGSLIGLGRFSRRGRLASRAPRA